jgi:hypothetical protein
MDSPIGNSAWKQRLFQAANKKGKSEDDQQAACQHSAEIRYRLLDHKNLEKRHHQYNWQQITRARKQ